VIFQPSTRSLRVGLCVSISSLRDVTPPFLDTKLWALMNEVSLFFLPFIDTLFLSFFFARLAPIVFFHRLQWVSFSSNSFIHLVFVFFLPNFFTAWMLPKSEVVNFPIPCAALYEFLFLFNPFRVFLFFFSGRPSHASVVLRPLHSRLSSRIYRLARLSSTVRAGFSGSSRASFFGCWPR